MINNTWKTARKIVVTTGLMGTLLLSTACGGSNTDDATPAPEPETTVSASDSPSESPTASPSPTETANPNIIDSVPVKEGMVSDGIGEYRQTTISDDDPAMKYNPSKASEFAKTNFTPEELAAVQKQSTKFLAEEGLDSIAHAGGESQFKEWWSKNEGLIHPSFRETFYTTEITDPKSGGIVLRNTWREGKYETDYSETTRIKDRSITVTSIDGGTAPDGQLFVTVKSNIAYKTPIIVQGKESSESVTGTTSYTWLKDNADSKWKIAGYQVAYNATETAR